jgi:VanZ family protein
MPKFAIRSRASVVCITLCIGYLIAGLWPFNFHAHNKAQWSPDGEGLHFEPLAIVTSSGTISLGSAPPGANGTEAICSIEMLISTEMEATSSIRSLISIYDGSFPENLFAAQWKDAFLVRIPLAPSHGRRKYREIGVDNALPPGKRRHLAITFGAGGTSLYIQGRLAETYPRLALRPGSLEGELIVGDSANGSPAFTGTLFGLALFNRTLGPTDVDRHRLLWETGRAGEIAAERGLAGLYLFNQAQGSMVADLSPFARTLVIPEYYRLIHKRLLVPPWANSGGALSQIQDITLNILGFVPFGFFCFVWRRGRGRGRASSVAAALAASVIVSAAIEVTQVFLPTRSSSLTDLMCNIAGGCVGVAMAIKRKNATECTEKN